MATIYTTRLYAGIISAGGATGLYTAPSGGRVIVRDVVAVALSSSSNTGYISVPGGIPIAFYDGLAQYVTAHFEGRQVLDPSEELSFNLISGEFSLLVTGYVLNS